MKYNRDEILKTINLLHPDGDLFEIRCISTGKGKTLVGFFNSPDDLFKALDEIDDDKEISYNYYIVLNRINEDIITKKNISINRFGNTASTSDEDILEYCFLLIDFDVEHHTKDNKKYKIPSTDVEKELAFQQMEKVKKYLSKNGFSEPVIADSGNGIHLLYPVCFPADETHQNEWKECLYHLSKAFSTKTVDDVAGVYNTAIGVDRAVSNPARVCKLYGTVAKKSEPASDERPYREAHIISIPAEIKKTDFSAIRNIPERIRADFPSLFNSVDGKASRPEQIANAEFVGDLSPDEALDCIHCPSDYNEWLSVSTAYKSAGGNYQHWDDWCRSGDNYNSKVNSNTWNALKQEGGITERTLYFYAKQSGKWLPYRKKQSTEASPVQDVDGMVRYILSLSKDDLLTSDKPFKILFASANSFIETTLIDALSSRNKELKTGCSKKDIIKKYEAYRSSFCKTAIPSASKYPYNANGIEIVLDLGKYRINNNSVEDSFGNIVCQHPIVPVALFTNIDDETERVTIAFQLSSKWKTVTLPKSAIASTSTLSVKLSEKGVAISQQDNAKAISKYLTDVIQLNRNVYGEKESVSHLGWIDRDCKRFAPYDEGIVFDGEEQNRNDYNAITKCGEASEWLDMMKLIRKDSLIVRIVLASSLSSALIKLFAVSPYWLHLWGLSETGKTVLLRIGASVWGNPSIDAGDYIITFNGTSYALEVKTGFLSSIPLIVDELEISVTSGIDDFQSMIYKLCEGQGKLQGNREGGLQKQRKWNNCIISSGEQKITNSRNNSGALNRTIEIEISNPFVDKNQFGSICDCINNNYGFAGRMFVELLKSNTEPLKEIRMHYYNDLLSKNITGKQAVIGSIILTADYLATKHIFKDACFITVDELSVLLKNADDVNQPEKAIEYFFEQVARNRIHFSNAPSGTVDKTEYWGYITADGYCNIIGSKFDEIMKQGGFDARSVLSYADKKGLLQSNSGRLRKRLSCKGFPNGVCILMPKASDDSEIDGNTVDSEEALPFD